MDTECEDVYNGTESETRESSDSPDNLSKYQSGDEIGKSYDCDIVGLKSRRTIEERAKTFSKFKMVRKLYFQGDGIFYHQGI